MVVGEVMKVGILVLYLKVGILALYVMMGFWG